MPNSNKYIAPVLTSEDIEIDPAAPGTVIRYAMAIEAGLNVFGATIMLLYPSEVLSYMVTKPSANTAASAALAQWLGALTCGLAVQLLCAIRNTRGAIESRRAVYYTLGAGEGFLIPLLLWQASSISTEKGLTSNALAVCARCYFQR
jgi:Na+-driven multidrug efflux pump